MSWTITQAEKTRVEQIKDTIIEEAKDRDIIYDVTQGGIEGVLPGHYSFNWDIINRQIEMAGFVDSDRDDIIARLKQLEAEAYEVESELADVQRALEGEETSPIEFVSLEGLAEGAEEEGSPDVGALVGMGSAHVTDDEFEREYGNILERARKLYTPELFQRFKEGLRKSVGAPLKKATPKDMVGLPEPQKSQPGRLVTLEELNQMVPMEPLPPSLNSVLPASITMLAAKGGMLFPIRDCFAIAQEAYPKIKKGKMISWEDITKIIEKYSDRIKKLALRVYDVNEKSMDFGQAYYEMSFKVAIGIEQLLENDGYGYHPQKEAWYKVRG